MPFSVSATAVLSLVLSWLVYRFLLYPACLSPLAKIPNAHWSSCISPAWILVQRWQWRGNRMTTSAHARKGPVIRLAPNEISINCVDGGLRTVYAGGFEKPEWYSNQFPNYGIPNMFATEASRPHSHRKRIMSHIYSKSTMQTSASVRAISHSIIFDRFLPTLARAAAAGPLDVYFLFNCVTMDFVTAYIFGLRHSTNFLHDQQTARWWLDLYQSRRTLQFWGQELPTTQKWLKRIGIRFSPPFVAEANAELEAHALAMVNRALDDDMDNDKSKTLEQPENVPTVCRLLADSLLQQARKPGTVPLASPETPLNLQVAAELLDHFSAGHETSAITLTYLFWQLARHPDVESSLRDELRTLPTRVSWPQSWPQSQKPTLPDPKDLDRLPLLHAALMETLRLHPAIPGPQPRRTPANATIGPFANLPAGVRVSALAYALHKNPSVYPAPLEWRPQRWLPVGAGDARGAARLAEQHRWFWAFGSGGRMCIGSNLAMQQMKLIVASVVTNWRCAIVDDAGIEQEDVYTAAPVGHQLTVRFAPWEG